METTRKIPILRCLRGICSEKQDPVVCEGVLRILLADQQGEEVFALVRTLMAELEDLVAGLLFTSRIIASPSDVTEIRVQGHTAKVTLTEDCHFREKMERIRPQARLVTGVCGPDEGALGSWRACDLPPIESPLKVDPSTVTLATRNLSRNMPLFRATGGTHGAALADPKGQLLTLAEDVGRHNAVDRAIGKALMNGLLPVPLLVCTGRLTADLVLKAAVARIPLLASISAPVEPAIQLAQQAGITLIGFARGHRMNIYTHSNRIRTKTRTRISEEHPH